MTAIVGSVAAACSARSRADRPVASSRSRVAIEVIVRVCDQDTARRDVNAVRKESVVKTRAVLVWDPENPPGHGKSYR